MLIAAGLAWLLLWSTPMASDGLRGWLEDQAGPRAIEAVQPAALIVVLGGAMGEALPPRRAYPDLGSAADRVWHAARLHKAGKAPRILVSGGSPAWAPASEAQAMRTFLLDLGVPGDAIVLEGGSRTTRENAAYSARLAGPQGAGSVILVTSALHMRRARGIFEREGLRVIPAPTDFEVVDKPLEALDLLPSTQALDGSTRAIKELVARWTGR
ncbi:MAG TPA: YdcF family protein [Ramlibacter sp.]|nr:YdcF family protein [Ramlibacter sp.]